MLFVTALDEMVQAHILNVLAFFLWEHFCILSKLAQMFWSSGNSVRRWTSMIRFQTYYILLLSVTIPTGDLIDLGGSKLLPMMASVHFILKIMTKSWKRIGCFGSDYLPNKCLDVYIFLICRMFPFHLPNTSLNKPEVMACCVPHTFHVLSSSCGQV